jgi:HPt (histidine-containing phosphotransfer) domain-containing protein
MQGSLERPTSPETRLGTLLLRRDLVVHAFDAVFSAWTGVAPEHAVGKNLALFLPSLLLTDTGAVRRVFDENRSSRFSVTLDVRSADEHEPVRVAVELDPVVVDGKTMARFTASRIDRARPGAAHSGLDDTSHEARAVRERLEMLGLLDDAKALEEALCGLVVGVRECRTLLGEAIRRGDVAAAAATAHRLKGTASSLGAARLTASAFALELALRSAASDVTQLLTDASHAIDHVIDICQRLREEAVA